MDRGNKERPLCTGLGEILFDCLPGGERLGGAPVNFAYSAKALGLRAAAVSAVGRDERGDRARRLLAEKGIAAHLAETDRETGRVDVLLDTDGVPSYHFLPEPAYGSIPWTEALARLAEETDICCFGTLAQWGEVSRRTVRRFLASMRPAALRVFDVNLRGTFYTEEIIRGSLRCADAVKCSEEELERLASAAGCGGAGPDDLAAFLRGMGICKLIYYERRKREPCLVGRETVGDGQPENGRRRYGGSGRRFYGGAHCGHGLRLVSAGGAPAGGGDSGVCVQLGRSHAGVSAASGGTARTGGIKESGSSLFL